MSAVKRKFSTGIILVLVITVGQVLSSAQAEIAVSAIADSRHFDTLLVGGHVADGSGEKRFRADVGIISDRIAAVGDLSTATANRRISVEGRIVAPGFIDLHAHIADGDVGGSGLLSTDARERAAVNYVSQGVTTALGNPDGYQTLSLNAQREALTRLGIGLNIALTNGHNGLRRMVMGDDQERPATSREISHMLAILHHDLEHEGSFGLSLGTEYYSGLYSTTEEQVALARILPAYNGIFIPHMRSQGISPMWYRPSVHKNIEPPTWHDAVDEVITVAHETGVKAVITHMKARGPGFRSNGRALVAKIQAARDRGDRVFMDVYPYNSSGSDGEFVAIPSWGFDGFEALRNNDLEHFDYTAALKKTLDGISPDRYQDLVRDIRHEVLMRGGAENILVLSHPDKLYSEKRLSDVMAYRGEDEVEALLALQLTGSPTRPGGGQLRSLSIDEEDIEIFYSQPWAATSTDGWVVLPEEAIGEQKYVNTHRRCFGSFPRRIAHYSQERGVDTLEQAIRSMTELPAEILGLVDRGRIGVGMKADVVVLNMEELRDNTTYIDPSVYPSGIEYVFVNGVSVVDEGERTLALPGQVLSPPVTGSATIE